jgi:hypothetical protein
VRTSDRFEDRMRVDGEDLIVPKSMRALPAICCRCGGESSGEPLALTFKWHEPVYYGALLLGLVPYIVIGAIMSKHHRLVVHLCHAHQSERRKRMIVGYAALPLLAISFCLVVRPRGLGGLIVVLAIFALMLVGLFTAARASRVLVVRHMDGLETLFSGASTKLLSARAESLAKVFE